MPYVTGGQIRNTGELEGLLGEAGIHLQTSRQVNIWTVLEARH
jgi:hypothetical protein